MITISKTLSGETQEKGQTLTIETGEIMGITGTAGAGKTSLLKSAAGIISGYHDVLINGQNPFSIAQKDKNILISHNIGISMKNREELLLDFLITSRIPFKKRFHSFGDIDREICEKYASSLELTDYLDKPLGSLSPSLLRRSLVCFSLIREAEVLILDEPSALQDLRSAVNLVRALTRFAAAGPATILIASNDINFVLQVADRIAIIHNHAVAEVLSPAGIDSDIIEKYFRTETLISRNIYNGRPMVHYYTEN